MDEFVALIAVLDELAKNFARQVGAVKNPFLHSHEILNELLVIHMLHETDVFINHQTGRVEQQKTEIHHVGWKITEGVDYPVYIYILHPHMQQPLFRIKVGRGHRGYQILDFFRVQGRVDDAECPPHADAHEIDFFRPCAAYG